MLSWVSWKCAKLKILKFVTNCTIMYMYTKVQANYHSTFTISAEIRLFFINAIFFQNYLPEMLEIVCSKNYLFVEFFHHLNGSQNFRKTPFLLQEWKNEFFFFLGRRCRNGKGTRILAIHYLLQNLVLLCADNRALPP